MCVALCLFATSGRSLSARDSLIEMREGKFLLLMVGYWILCNGAGGGVAYKS